MKYWRTKSSTPVRCESTTQLIDVLHNKSVMYKSLHAQDENFRLNALKRVLHFTARTARLFFIFQPTILLICGVIASTASSCLRL